MLFTGISFCEIDSSIDTLYKRTVHDMSALLDSPQNDASDSIASMVYDTICTMLRINDSLSRIDSIQRQSLVDQLDSIKPNNSKLKKLLENRIDSITHSDSMRMEKHKVVVSSLRENVIGYPVMLANDTLIIIYSKYGSFTAQERASVISKRILDVARVVGFNTDAFSVFRNETSHDIMYSDKILMSITDNDAFFLESTPDALAQQYLSTIKDSISSYRKNRSFISYT